MTRLGRWSGGGKVLLVVWVAFLSSCLPTVDYMLSEIADEVAVQEDHVAGVQADRVFTIPAGAEFRSDELLVRFGRPARNSAGKVVAGKVEVRVQVTSLTDEVIKKLAELGFTELARAKSVKLLIGTIDVTQLEALAKLAEVRRIEPAQ